MDYVSLNLIVIVDVVAMYSDCGCIDRPSLKLEEYNIQNLVFRSPKINLNKPKINYICDLKEKVVCEYYQILQDLECGKHPDLEFILQEISLIDIYYEQ